MRPTSRSWRKTAKRKSWAELWTLPCHGIMRAFASNAPSVATVAVVSQGSYGLTTMRSNGSQRRWPCRSSGFGNSLCDEWEIDIASLNIQTGIVSFLTPNDEPAWCTMRGLGNVVLGPFGKGISNQKRLGSGPAKFARVPVKDASTRYLRSRIVDPSPGNFSSAAPQRRTKHVVRRAGSLFGSEHHVGHLPTNVFCLDDRTEQSKIGCGELKAGECPPCNQ